MQVGRVVRLLRKALGNIPDALRFKPSPWDSVARIFSFTIALVLEYVEADEWKHCGLNPGPPTC